VEYVLLPLKILAEVRRKIKVRVEYCINCFQTPMPLTRHQWSIINGKINC